VSQKVTREDARKERICDLCGVTLVEGDEVSGGRGKTILGPRWAGRMVVVHESCLERHNYG
jgi:hypothetical protein